MWPEFDFVAEGAVTEEVYLPFTDDQLKAAAHTRWQAINARRLEMAHDSGLSDETMSGGTPDDGNYGPGVCHCGRPAAVGMSMSTAFHNWEVGYWLLCEAHTHAALKAAGIAAPVDLNDTWEPEDVRTVTWNAEQTEHLLRRIAATEPRTTEE